MVPDTGTTGTLSLSDAQGNTLGSYSYILDILATVTATVPQAQVTNTSFLLEFSPAVPDIQPGDITLSPSVAVTATTPNADNTQYTVRTNAMEDGTAYTVTIQKPGFRFSNSPTFTGVDTPYTGVDVTVTVEGVMPREFTLKLSPGVPGLTVANMRLTPPLTIRAVTADTAEGTAYTVRLEDTDFFVRNQAYTLHITKSGYTIPNAMVTRTQANNEATLVTMTLTVEGFALAGSINTTDYTVTFPNAPHGGSMTGTVLSLIHI